MAKRKRVTLPRAFDELIKAGDVEGLKALYDHCELNATYGGRYGMYTALHRHDAPSEFVRWLVKQGLDVNTPNYYDKTPLYEHALYGSDTVPLLIELGADINRPDRYGNTPLHAAANSFRVDTIRFLIQKGADMHAQNDKGQTPLSSSLALCRGANIPSMARSAVIFLDAGERITPEMRKSVKRIGDDFEFYRDTFNKDYLAETDAGLQKLYELFDVTPVARRRMHDGTSPIIAAESESWKQAFRELWDLLVPASGAAQTVQGEVIRIAGRVQDELYRNGGANWDKHYRKMLDALIGHLASGTPLTPHELQEAQTITTAMRRHGNGDFAGADRLCELSVSWIRKNPNPIVLRTPDYNR